MADAYAAGLGALHFSLPNSDLHDEACLRATLSRDPRSSGKTGTALFGAARALPSNTARLYSLEFGILAPQALRRIRTPTSQSWRLEAQLSVLCLPARFWGVPIRAAALFGRSDLSDRAMFGMRRTFAARRPRPAYYHLYIWSCL